MESKKELSTKIRDRVNSLVRDTNTYLYVKTKSPNFYDEGRNVGGGNFLSALGIFSCLSFLSKTYCLLSDKLRVADKTDKDELKKVKKDIISKHPQYEEVLSRYLYVVAGQMNETEAFTILVQDIHNEIDLGLPIYNPELIKDHWRQLRNALSHMAYPKITVFSSGVISGETYGEVSKRVLNSTDTAFFDLGVKIELLARDLVRIVDWLEKGILKDNFKQENISKTLQWINDSYLISQEEFDRREKHWSLLS